MGHENGGWMNSDQKSSVKNPIARERPAESQWRAGDIDINVHASDMDGLHVGISFIAGDMYSKVDLHLDNVIKLRDELTRIATDTLRCDESIRCTACGYTWNDAHVHLDHRHCRNYPFFPDESGESHAK